MARAVSTKTAAWKGRRRDFTSMIAPFLSETYAGKGRLTLEMMPERRFGRKKGVASMEVEVVAKLASWGVYFPPIAEARWMGHPSDCGWFEKTSRLSGRLEKEQSVWSCEPVRLRGKKTFQKDTAADKFQPCVAWV